MSYKEKRMSGLKSPVLSVDERDQPVMDKKKAFATVALAKTRQTRRPSTVTMFSNSPNPFAEPERKKSGDGANGLALGEGGAESRKTMNLRSSLAANRDDSTLRGKTQMEENENATFDSTQVLDASPEEAAINRYRSREPLYRRGWSVREPFQFATSTDLAVAGHSFAQRGSEARIDPQAWEQKGASYNDWELGMLHKLALAAAVLLTPADDMTNAMLEEKLDEIAAGDTSERAKPVKPPTPMVRLRSEKSIDSEDMQEYLSPGTPGSSRADRSPRSPPLTRKQKYGSWSAKVAAAKKKSWERKRGADTISALRQEEGLSVAVVNNASGDPSPQLDRRSSERSVLTIFNKDGGPASGTSSTGRNTPVGTPTQSPVVKRKEFSPDGPSSRASTPVQMRKGGRFGSIRGKRMSMNLGKTEPPPDGDQPAFPGLSLRKSDAAAFEELKKANEQQKNGGDSDKPAFPGMSLRSSDAKAFQELLQADKQKKEEKQHAASPTSPTSPSGASSPSEGDSPPQAAVSSPTTPVRRATTSRVGQPPPKHLNLSFLNRRQSAGPVSPNSASANDPMMKSPKKEPQKSPKVGRRFSQMFARKDGASTSGPLSPKGAPEQQPALTSIPMRTSGLASAPGTPASPRSNKSGGLPRLARTSPRASQTPQKMSSTFSRRKNPSPRTFDSAPVSPGAASPPLSARELMADASTLAALDDLVGTLEESPRPDDEIDYL